MSVSRLWHTLRWLRFGQLLAQLRQRLAARFEPVRVPPAPEFPGLRWQPRGELPAPGAQRNSADALLQGDFTFLNRRESLGFPPASWQHPELPRLWEYNLHYFEVLYALPFDAAARLARDWIEQHPLARGRVGWEPYPLSLRLQNWCVYFFGRHREATLADAGLCAALWRSVHDQSEWLTRHLETHLLGNHLFENAAALALCGACFDGPSAERWRGVGAGLLGRESAEQILPDGGHFERSPLYQARIAWLLQALGWSGDAELLACTGEVRTRCEAALAWLTHPDGEIALLNDSAFGIANAPGDLLAGEASAGTFALRDTGYYGAREAAGHYLVCDAAPIGPDYLPGHAHGDMLAFELSLAGQRVFVDAGVYDYEPGELRSFCRSTAAHNTVEIEGVDQCEFWAAFRVARRGRPHDVVWQARDTGFSLEAWHDGYQRLPGRPRHDRAFRWHAGGVLLVRDRVRAERPVVARTWLHLHPDCEVAEQDGLGAWLRFPGGSCRVAFAGEGSLALLPSRHCPEFGVVRESLAFCFTARGAAIENGFAIAYGADSLRYALAAGAQLDGTTLPF
jgi:uncharacterized heparinase superfamily protein